jgi:hypothetical protein
VEDLDPDISHFEFFLSPGEPARHDWSDDGALLAARGRRNRCLWGWPGTALLDSDMAPLDLSADGLALLQAVEASGAAGETGSEELSGPLGALPLGWERARLLETARTLQRQQVLLLQAGACNAA